MTKTLSEPSTDDKQINLYNRGMAAAEQIDLPINTKLALVVLELNSAVLPSDYAQLRTDIIAITGITDVTLVVDNQDSGGTIQTATNVPAGKKLVGVFEANLRIEDNI